MVDDILFRPDRDWLASSGAGDIALYGAPSDPTVNVRAADAPALDVTDKGGSPAPSPELSGTGAPRQVAEVDTGSTLPNIQPEAASSALAPTAFAPAQNAFSPTDPSIADGGASIPAPAPTSGLTSRGEMEPAKAAPVMSDLAGPGLAALAPVGAPTALVEEAIAPLGLGAPVIGTILPDAASLADPVLESATSLVDDVLPDVGALAAPALPLDAVAVQADSLAEDATDLLGADPEGGIATLVSLVSLSDIMDLRDAGEEDGPDSASAMIDALAADLVTADPLQAETERDDDDGLPVDALGDAPVVAADIAPPPLPVDPPVDDLLDGLGL